MDLTRRAAIVTELAERLLEKGGWVGETQIQKAVYLLQTQLGVPTEYEFILYRHGPFSFELRDELNLLRGDGFFEWEEIGSYGPRWIPTSQSKELRNRFPKTLGKYNAAIDYDAKKLAGLDVRELEKLATAQYVCEVEADASQRPLLMNMIKPHIKPDDAAFALKQLEEFSKNKPAVQM